MSAFRHLDQDEPLQVTMDLRCLTYMQIRSGVNLKKENDFPGGMISKDLPMSAEGKFRSPTGFNWGYGGSGPYALAHSILTVMYGDELADKFAMDFKWEVISKLPNGKPWILLYSTVRGWMKAKGIDHTYNVRGQVDTSSIR